MNSLRRRSRDEAGIFLVLWAAFLLGLFAMVAIVLDLGALRADRRKSRAAADAAATAGAQAVPLGSISACEAAWRFALVNLEVSSATSPCTAFPACNTTTPMTRVRDQTVGSYRIFIAYPVASDADGGGFLAADAVGADISQPADATADGTPCERLAVRIELIRRPIFARVLGDQANTTSAHSVARYKVEVGGGGDKPALVALAQTRNCSVNAGNGLIHAVATGNQPALIYTDSDGTGTNCGGGGDTVFEGGNPGRIWADPSPLGAPGELGYFAPTLADAFSSDPSYDQNGSAPPVGANKTKLVTRITRRPVDATYQCGSVVPALPAVPGCTTGLGGTDFISDVEARYGNVVGAPAGFTVFPGAAIAGTCSSPPGMFPPGQNWYISCPTFSVTTPVTFQDRDVVFSGNVEIGSGGVLTFNSFNAADTIVVVRGTTGITTSSNTWTLNWNRTFVLMDNGTCPASRATCGRLDIQNGFGTWTAPTLGIGKDLIFWSETTQAQRFQGNPLFTWEGVFFAPNSVFEVVGNATVDATEVQLWVDGANVQNNSASLLLRADPDKSLATTRIVSTLIR